MNQEVLCSRTVLVVGGSSGIGFGIAKSCINVGAQVVIASPSRTKLQEAQKQLGKSCRIEQVDVHNPESIERMVSVLDEIDHLVVTVGQAQRMLFLSMNEQRAREDMDINFWSKFRLAKYVQPKLSDCGSLLFISGAFVHKPNPDFFMTTIALSAVEQLSRLLALEIAPLRVNVIAPYIVRENQSLEGKREVGSSYIGTFQDVGQAAVFALSNPYVSGATIQLDGGYSIS